MDEALKVLVVGGMNVDILGTPENAYHPGDSLPGTIRLSVGGVGFNIASHLARSGASLTFVTAIGNDAFAGITRKACQALGLDTSLAYQFPGPSPIYMAIHQEEGKMAAAISDMAAMEHLDSAHLMAHQAALQKDYDICVVDANLPEDCLRLLPRLVRAPILADPVSVEKGRRLLPILPDLFAIKPNALEVLALSGCRDIPEAANWFLDQGVHQVFISLDQEGLYFASAAGTGRLAPEKVLNVPSTGAGDAMAAGLARGIALKKSAEDTAKMGLSSAANHLNRKLMEV